MEFLKKKINDLLTKKKFINHNKKVFEKISQNSSSNGKILVEFNNFISNHIGFSGYQTINFSEGQIKNIWEWTDYGGVQNQVNQLLQ